MVLVAVAWFGRNSANGICRALNRLQVPYNIVLPNEIPEFDFTHVIISGGPIRLYQKDRLPRWILDSNCPVLGIGYGMHLILHSFNESENTVSALDTPEHGPVNVTEIIEGKQQSLVRWMAREDRVTSVPTEFMVTGVTDSNDIATVTDGKRWWGVQYHPEARRFGDDKVFSTFIHTG